MPARGRPGGLAERIAGGELVPDFGPPRPHPTGGAVLVTARPPLVAFNVDLETRRPRAGAGASRPSCASRAAACRACARSACPSPTAGGPRCRPTSTTTAPRRCGEIVDARPRARAGRRGGAGRPGAEAAFEGFPADVPLRGFDAGPAPHRGRVTLRLAATMAQTKKKRTRKHRGTPAGTIERPGRTGTPAGARTRTRSRSPRSAARSGSTSRRPGAARSTARRSRRSSSRVLDHRALRQDVAPGPDPRRA